MGMEAALPFGDFLDPRIPYQLGIAVGHRFGHDAVLFAVARWIVNPS